MLHRVLDGAQEIVAVARRQMPDRSARDDEAEGVDRIGRVRNEHNVARRGDGLRHVGEAFLRAERRDDLRLGIELHAEPALVIGRLCLAQPRYALRRRIPMRARLVDRLDQLVDDVLRRRHIGVAHAEIDDVGAAGARRRLQTVHLREYIGRQALDAVKVFAQRFYPSAPERGRRHHGVIGSRPMAIRGHRMASVYRACRRLPPSLRLPAASRPVPRRGASRNSVDELAFAKFLHCEGKCAAGVSAHQMPTFGGTNAQPISA